MLLYKTLQMYVFEEPVELRDGQTLEPAWSFDFKWPDGARDCEAATVDAAKDEILLISKKRVPPELYRLPLRPTGKNTVAVKIGDLMGIEQPDSKEMERNPVYGRYRSQVTAADLSPNGRVLIVLNYHALNKPRNAGMIASFEKRRLNLKRKQVFNYHVPFAQASRVKFRVQGENISTSCVSQRLQLLHSIFSTRLVMIEDEDHVETKVDSTSVHF